MIVYDSDLSKNYNQYHSQPKNYFNLQVAKIVHYLELNNDSFVLDVGCGSGRLLKPISNMVAHVIGVEKSKDMYKECNIDLPSNSLCINSNFLELDSPILFSGIYFSMSLHQIRNESKVFEKCNRLLTEDGKVLVITVSENQFKEILINKYFPTITKIDSERFLTLFDLRDVLERSGFEIESIEEHTNYLKIPKDVFINMLRNKYISSLQLISKYELKCGIKQVERDYGEIVTVPDCYTYVVGKKV